MLFTIIYILVGIITMTIATIRNLIIEFDGNIPKMSSKQKVGLMIGIAISSVIWPLGILDQIRREILSHKSKKTEL